MSEAAAMKTADIGRVEDRFFTIRDFRLANGEVMPEATISYETYGRLQRHGRNAVLITHGYTGSHHQAGRNPANNDQPGLVVAAGIAVGDQHGVAPVALQPA